MQESNFRLLLNYQRIWISRFYFFPIRGTFIERSSVAHGSTHLRIGSVLLLPGSKDYGWRHGSRPPGPGHRKPTGRSPDRCRPDRYRPPV